VLPDSPTVSVTVAAKALGIGRAKAHRLIREGVFPVAVIRVGSRVRVPTVPLRRLLEGGEAA
jgi:predicted site-specific integrase-resolvase